MFFVFRPHATSLGYLSSADVYEDKSAYPTATDIPNIKIFRFEENIFYANVDMFKKLFNKRIGLRVEDSIKAMNDEILAVEREFKQATAKPNTTLMNFKRRFQKNNLPPIEETIEIDETKLTEEKQAKVKSKHIFRMILKCLF